jgi:hypothetical protein
MRPEIKVYIASKLEHADKLAAIRKDGFHINARWIDMAEIHRKKMKPVTHWQQENFDDIEAADYVIFYIEAGDHLKGGIFELGYAVRAGKKIWIAGDGHGVEVTIPDGATGDDVKTMRVPHKDIFPWGHYAQAIHIAPSLDAAFSQIKAEAFPDNKLNSRGVSTVPPSVLYKPVISLDGNQYCALYGDDLMAGCAGFGSTMAEAMADFDKNWANQKAPTPAKPQVEQ